jgi:hypothetical protein
MAAGFEIAISRSNVSFTQSSDDRSYAARMRVLPREWVATVTLLLRIRIQKGAAS